MSCITLHNNPGCIMKPILQSKEISNVPRVTQPEGKARFRLPLKLSPPPPPSCKPKCRKRRGRVISPHFQSMIKCLCHECKSGKKLRQNILNHVSTCKGFPLDQVPSDSPQPLSQQKYGSPTEKEERHQLPLEGKRRKH